jgi:hypothetical protein
MVRTIEAEVFQTGLSPLDGLRHTSCSGQPRKCGNCGEDATRIREVSCSIHYTNNMCVIRWGRKNRLRNVSTTCHMGTAQGISNAMPAGVIQLQRQKQQNKLRGLSPRANYTDRATAACRRS